MKKENYSSQYEMYDEWDYIENGSPGCMPVLGFLAIVLFLMSVVIYYVAS